MDVAFGPCIHKPRRLVLEVNAKDDRFRYTCCTQGEGESYDSESSLMTLDEWMTWLDRFSDDLTGRELREAREAVREPFIEPPGWRGFRERFATTGDPWLK